MELRHHFVDGPFLEVLSADAPVLVEFLSGAQVIHSGVIKQGEWIRANRRYYCEWTIRVSDLHGGILYEYLFDIESQNIRIYLDSKSLGDTLAWIPQVARFAEAHPSTTIYVSYHWANLIDESAYSNLTFISPQDELSPCYASYSIGYYFEDLENRHPADPRLRSLQNVASDILGLSEEERRPLLLNSSIAPVAGNRTVTIATTSTSACKHWLYPGGWQAVVDWLVGQGYRVSVIQKEPTNLHGIIDETGDQPITERIRQIYDSEVFIGLASGLSWLAWAINKPVIMIAGFSLPHTEFSSNCERIINRNVCHGCWNDPSHIFQRDDWNWCPNHDGSERQHECSRQISPEQVLAALGRLLAQN